MTAIVYTIVLVYTSEVGIGYKLLALCHVGLLILLLLYFAFYRYVKMESSFYLCQLSDVQITTVKTRLLTKVGPVGLRRGCQLWSGGQTKNGYPTISVSLNKKRYQLRAHRLHFHLQSGCQPFLPGLQVSHLCHEKLCMNLDHFSLELAVINNQRKTCNAEGHCFGHGAYRNCIMI